MHDALRTHHEVGKFSPLHYYVVCFCIIFCLILPQVNGAFHVLSVYNTSMAFQHTVPCSYTDFMTPGLRFTRGHYMKREKYTIYLQMGFHGWQWSVNLYKNK